MLHSDVMVFSGRKGTKEQRFFLSAERQSTNVFSKLDKHYITVSGYVLVLVSHIVPHKLIIVPHLVCLMVVTLITLLT